MNLAFNQSPLSCLHLDINSCFATIEQQANPFLREKSVVVCSYLSSSAVILAASIQAKRLGIKTGMRVFEAKRIDSGVVCLLPDPDKYRYVNKILRKIIEKYSPIVATMSIDEFSFQLVKGQDPRVVVSQIKKDVKNILGEVVTVSVGVSTNRYLAKVASGIIKPDGFFIIDSKNYMEVFSKLKLTELNSIKTKTKLKLNLFNIKTVQDFYNSPLQRLLAAYGGIDGYYWYLKIRGYNLEEKGAFKSKPHPKSLGHSYAPPPLYANNFLGIASKLCEKIIYRLLNKGLDAGGICFMVKSKQECWKISKKLKKRIDNYQDLKKAVFEIYQTCPIKSDFKNIAISLFDLSLSFGDQKSLFENTEEIKKRSLEKTIHDLRVKHGFGCLFRARSLLDTKVAQDRISFGQV